MAGRTTIEWTHATWNPTTGCSKISPGCKHCYAERLANRLEAMGHPNYVNGFQLTVHEHLLEVPLKWKRARTVFVDSMSDLFHEDVPLEFIRSVFDVMRRAKQHQFQVLTKRSQRLKEVSDSLTWPENVWMGVSVENSDFAFRIADLQDTSASVKFLSLEPLLEPINHLELGGIDWVIVGGESGPKARPMLPQWALSVRDQCSRRNVPFFFKQWGGRNKKKSGRLLEGRIWSEMPAFAIK